MRVVPTKRSNKDPQTTKEAGSSTIHQQQVDQQPRQPVVTAQLASWAKLTGSFWTTFSLCHERVEEPLLVIFGLCPGLVALAVEKLCIDIPLYGRRHFSSPTPSMKPTGFSQYEQ